MNLFNKAAFTLVELMLVVGVIAVLAGVTLTVMNPAMLRDSASDSVRYATLEKLVVGIEGYYAAEGSYPPQNITSNAETNAAYASYIRGWPSPTPTGQPYQYWVSADAQTFGVLVEASANLRTSSGAPIAYKYHPSYSTIMECSNLDVSNSDCGGITPPPPPPPPPVCELSLCIAQCEGAGYYFGGSCLVDGSCYCNPECAIPADCHIPCHGSGTCTSMGTCECW